MPGRGQHRRQRSTRLSRISLALTAGGAGIALPLAALSGTAMAAQPTPAAAYSAPVNAVPTGEAAEQDENTSASYTVVSGDTLSKIADARAVDGGWSALYETNRDVIGDNPDLILPGQELDLDGEPTADSASAEAGTASAEVRADRSADRADTAPEPEPEPEPAPQTAGFAAPVDAAPSTAYRAAGPMWGSGYHTGVDFSAPSGAPVSAVGAGTVVTAGWGGSYGNEVVIEHADGHYSQYAHLSSLSVSVGQQVGAGEQIGLVGSTGNSTGPHLHFEVRTGPSYGSDIDPLGYLRNNGVTI